MSISGRRLPPAAVNVVGGIFVGRADELSVPETAATAACRGQPQVVLVLVDDLQWTDRPSARALPFAVRPVAGRPDAGCGDTRLGSWHGWVRQRAPARQRGN